MSATASGCCCEVKVDNGAYVDDCDLGFLWGRRAMMAVSASSLISGLGCLIIPGMAKIIMCPGADDFENLSNALKASQPDSESFLVTDTMKQCGLWKLKARAEGGVVTAETTHSCYITTTEVIPASVMVVGEGHCCCWTNLFVSGGGAGFGTDKPADGRDTYDRLKTMIGTQGK